ncbi:MAG: histidine phosphatase family protein [Clostridia bacterium]|nr:histidine phosphatase family protein [Clostridia bacterium]
MVKFIVIRHGHSVSNKEKTYTGQLDVALSSEGIDQAKSLAEYLYENYKVDSVYSSNLIRAKHTADFVAEKFGLPVIIEEDLKEMYCGKWEGLTAEQAEALYPEDFLDWQTNLEDGRCTDGEWMSEIKSRAVRAIKKIAEENDGKTVVIVSHGCVIRALQGEWLGISYRELKEMPWVTNASITRVCYEQGKWSVLQTGYDGYLGNMRTEMPKLI